MTRAIFLQEFKRALVQAVLVLFPFLLGLIAIERLVLVRPLFQQGMLGGTPDAVIDMLVSALFIVSGFAFGISSFYRLTDRHIAFVHSLPVSRLQVWTAILSANLSSLLATTPFIFVLRPSLWTRTDTLAIGNLWPFALGLYLVLFGAGCCFAMLFRNVALATVVGGLIVAASLALTLLFSSALDGDVGNQRWYGVFISDNPDPAFWLLSSIVLAFLYLGLSLRFFVTGEFRLMTARIKNSILIIIVLATYPLLNSVAIEARLFGRPADDRREFASASYDGEYIAVSERLWNSSFVTKISFVEVRTGSVVGTYESSGLLAPIWSKSKPVLNVVALQSPFRRLGYMLPPSDSILRISPQGKKLDRVGFGFSQITNIQNAHNGRLLVLTEGHGRAELFSIDDGVKTQLLSTPVKAEAGIHPAFQSNVVTLYSAPAPGARGLMQIERAWSVGEDVREIPWAVEEKDRTMADFVLDGRLYSEKSAMAELKRRFPPKSEPIFYHSSQRFRDFSEGLSLSRSGYAPSTRTFANRHMFAVTLDEQSGGGQVLYFDPRQSGWRILGQALEFRRSNTGLSSSISNGYWGFGGTLVSGDGGVALFSIPRLPERDIYLYDADLDKRFLLSSVPASGESGCYMFEGVRGLRGLLVACGQSGFIYNSEDSLSKLPLVRWRNPIYMTNDGTQIYWFSDQVFYRPANGEERRLWPPQ